MAGDSVRLTVTSTDFVPILRLYHPGGTLHVQETGSEVEGVNVAIVEFVASTTGNWRASIAATEAVTGNYDLTVDCDAGVPSRELAAEAVIGFYNEAASVFSRWLTADAVVEFASADVESRVDHLLTANAEVIFGATAEANELEHPLNANAVVVFSNSCNGRNSMTLQAVSELLFETTADVPEPDEDKVLEALAFIGFGAGSGSRVNHMLDAGAVVIFVETCLEFDETLTLEEDESS